MVDELRWLQAWRLRMAAERPGDRPVVAIESLTTPGWVVSADFRDLGLDAAVYAPGAVRLDDDASWLSVTAEGPVLKVYCGPLMLEAALAVVRDFAGEGSS